MATRARTKKTADTATPAERCTPHGVAGTCWRCCDDDMADHLTATGRDPAKYFDGRNGEGTPEPRPRGTGGGNGNRPAEPATDAQVWRIRHERDRRDTTGVDVPADADIRALSKRAASTLIDRLTRCPMATTPARAYAPRAATAGQISYVRDLLAERVHVDPVNVETLTFDQASALIDALIRAPRLVDASPLPDGIYRKDGVMYRVKTDRHGRKMCHRGVIVEAEVRADDGTITTPAVIKFRNDWYALARLTEADLMTDDQVCAFGVSYGICVYGHALTDPVSVAAGIGPKCAANAGIDQLAVAIANGYVPPVKATRKARKPAPVAAPVVVSGPPADVPAEATDDAAYVSPWASL
jgi:hypothetical protein